MTIDAIKIAEKVLELNEIDDYAGILNLAASSKETCITKSSSFSSMRKLYLKLSLIIHPDKLGKKFANATKAFQAVVKALEFLSMGDVPDVPTSGSGKKKQATIARSNDNCYKTRVCCPRCMQPWNEGSLDGNPEYFYNFLMTGLKQYLCSTCLCEFGCMTAIHKCPHCKKQFEYSPSDYHKMVTCNNASCIKPFGFYMFPTSDRVINDVRQTVKHEQEQRMKARDAKQRRAARTSRGATLTESELEKSFMMGLLDICPRCGEDFGCMDDEEAQRRHLMDCVDEVRHKEFSSKKREQAAKAAEKQAAVAKQDSVQTHAVWQFLGANNEQLWLLEDEQLRSEAQQRGLDGSGDKEDLNSRLLQRDCAGSPNSSGSGTLLRLTNNDGALVLVAKDECKSIVSVTSRKRPRRLDSVPTNLHSMSVAQLRAVCASHDLLPLLRKNMSKAEILDVMEDAFYELQPNNTPHLQDTQLLLK